MLLLILVKSKPVGSYNTVSYLLVLAMSESSGLYAAKVLKICHENMEYPLIANL